MSKTLVIVEAPSKAKHIQSFLGSNYIVKASVGHIRELPIPARITENEKKKYSNVAQDLNTFQPLFKISQDKTKIVKELKQALTKVSSVILATDADAEGAAISWHLLQVLNPKVPTYRATWNEITEKAVKEGLKNKELIDKNKQEPKSFFNLAESAITRAQWDRLYGYKTSPYMWKVLKPGSSSGRVQTPGTKLVVEREERRLAFTSVSYYSIWGTFGKFKAKLVEYEGQKIADGSKINDNGDLASGFLLITDKNIDSIMSSLNTKDYIIGDIKSKPYRRTPPPPFTTSTGLQSIGEATRYSAKQITSIFQNLYQNGIITYIRTVSVVAAPEAIAEARKEISNTYGKKYIPLKPRIYKDKKSGNSGHECIRNVIDDKTGKLVNVKLTDPKEQKVFELIRNRFLASQSIDCEGTTWTAIFNSTDDKAKFSTSETIISELGWTKIYKEDTKV